MKKKILATLLLVCLLVSLMPTMAFAGSEEPVVATVNSVAYTDLAAAIAAAINTDYAVEITEDIDLTGKPWTPVEYNFGKLTINGNGKTVTGMSDSLLNKTGSGGHYLTINDLTFDKCSDTTPTGGDYPCAAIICPYADSMNELSFNGVTINDCTVVSTEYAGGFIGYAAGYNVTNNGPVFQHILFDNCKVTGCSITGFGSTGGLIGHAAGNINAKITVTDTTVTGNTITVTETGKHNKAGSLFGTVGAAGENADYPGRGLFASATVSGNTVTSDGTVITAIYGRQGTSSGKLTVTGGSYDAKPIADADASWATIPENYEMVENSGIWTVGKIVVAKIGETEYATLNEAIAAAKAGDTVSIVKAGSYELPNGMANITVEGVDGVAVDGSKNPSGWSNVTVKNITFSFGQDNYHGFQHNSNIRFEECTFNGLHNSYGTEYYYKCTFNQTKVEYCMWVYGNDVTYDTCTFNTKGKALNVYTEGTAFAYNLTVKDCTFVNNDAVKKPAVLIKSMCGANELQYNISLEGTNTLEGSWPSSESVYGDGNLKTNGLWDVEEDGTKILVLVNGDQVYPELEKHAVATGEGTDANATVQVTTVVDAAKTDEIFGEDADTAKKNTSVSGVELTTAAEEGKTSGLQNVINEAKEQNGEAVSAADDIAVKVDVKVVPTEYVPAEETVGAVSYSLEPVATVKVGGEIVADNIKVENEWLADSAITVSVYTGFEPKKIVHTGDDDFSETFLPEGTAGADKTFKYADGVCTMTIAHFSCLTAYSDECVAKVGGLYYTTLAEALAAAQSGDTVELVADSIEMPNITKEGITIQGKVDKDGNPVTKVTSWYWNNELSSHNKNVTYKNLLITATVSAYLDNTTFYNCKFTGRDGIRWSYALGNVTIEKCVFDTEVYGIHFDELKGDLLVKDCTLVGFNTYSATDKKITFTGCRFVDSEKNPYYVLQTWGNLTVTDCDFSEEWCTVNDNQTIGIASGTGICEMTNCTVAKGTMADAVANSADTGLVAIDATKNADGKYTAGTFVGSKTVLDANVAPDYYGDPVPAIGTVTVKPKTKVTIELSCADLTLIDIENGNTPSPEYTVSGIEAEPVITYSKDGETFGTWEEVCDGVGEYTVKAYIASTQTTKAATAAASFSVYPCGGEVEIQLSGSGIYNLVLGGNNYGEYEFTAVSGGYTIKSVESGEYVSFDNGSVVMSGTPYTWTKTASGFSTTKIVTTRWWLFGWHYNTKLDTYYLVNGSAGLAAGTASCTTKFTKQETYAEHKYEYTSNGDGTHDAVCSVCGHTEKNEKCSYENGRCRFCGALDPAYAGVKDVKVSVSAEKVYKNALYRLFGIVSSTRYNVTITPVCEGVSASKVSYSTDGSRFVNGTSFTSASNVTKLWVKVVDSNGSETEWLWANGSAQKLG